MARNIDTNPIDVWLKFEDENDEEPTYEANTFDKGGYFLVEWYHTAVGQVSSKDFDTYDEATEWLESEGFLDFSS
jgi:hypothetical protein